MKIQYSVFLIFSLVFIISCGSDSTGSQQTEEQGTDTTTTYQELGDRVSAQPMPDCEIEGKMLEGNKFYAEEEGLIIAIVADSLTYDEQYGDSHRLLTVTRAEDCVLKQRYALQVSGSPDYPYFISEITYNKVHEVIGLRGFNAIYYYDLSIQRLKGPLEPQFLQERYGVDAQSGMIQRLEVWEDYLVGYAQDYGTFAFDISEKQSPEPVLPFAEYEEEEQFYSLFLFPLKNDLYQAIMPEYNRESNSFSINPLFEKPQPISTNIPKSARNNRFLIFRDAKEGWPVAVDLLNRIRVELPDDVKTKKTQDILDWLKTNES